MLLFFCFDHFLGARAEIRDFFSLFFWKIEDTKIFFWNFLTFNIVLDSNPKTKDERKESDVMKVITAWRGKKRQKTKSDNQNQGNKVRSIQILKIGSVLKLISNEWWAHHIVSRILKLSTNLQKNFVKKSLFIYSDVLWIKVGD